MDFMQRGNHAFIKKDNAKLHFVQIAKVQVRKKTWSSTVAHPKSFLFYFQEERQSSGI